MNITFDSFIQPQIKGITFRIPDPEFRMLKKFYGSRISNIEKNLRIPDPEYRILKKSYGSRIPDIGY